MVPDAPESIEILPLVVVTQSFPARPSALPDVRAFLRRQLTGRPVSDDDVRQLCDRVADVLLTAAGVTGRLQISLRIFPSWAEVDVLSTTGDEVPAPAPPPARADPAPAATPLPGTREPAPSFALWLTALLRSEGLTMEAAARRLDVSTKTISRWVSGATEPRLRDLYRIQEIFGEAPFR
ncbi:XRE family transcriptional regulator [Actinoplanes ianthinogenes]|uniref:XRE family transcriptional regulator n=1 Tax=Actinoplanes ianthinogenes TaxID=122358 RepID=A0ABM7M2R8_9ACTN|nr:helix-turn-helix transcriptional regulator [Actinoplanes ianthinogenes]BCJ45925.1 XRE family transcriptional regulator [Actinoplanes ianthinogenes]GGR31103.1 XRE family transcriptional regulator [Actinoplanes ianthinogenes]